MPAQKGARISAWVTAANVAEVAVGMKVMDWVAEPRVVRQMAKIGYQV